MPGQLAARSAMWVVGLWQDRGLVAEEAGGRKAELQTRHRRGQTRRPCTARLRKKAPEKTYLQPRTREYLERAASPGRHAVTPASPGHRRAGRSGWCVPATRNWAGAYQVGGRGDPSRVLSDRRHDTLHTSLSKHEREGFVQEEWFGRVGSPRILAPSFLSHAIEYWWVMSMV